MSPRKLLAFLRRDVQTALSYRTAFVFELLGMAAMVVTYWFLASMIERAGGTPRLPGYAGGYFAFVLVGWAVLELQSFALAAFQARVRDAQVMGTMDALLTTPTTIPEILVGSVLYDFAGTVVRFVVFLSMGALFFGLDVGRANFGAAALVLVATLLVLGSLGLVSAAAIMVFKRWSPIPWLFNGAAVLLGGVYYPPDVLPPWMARAAAWFPFTQSLDAVRRTLVGGQSVAELAPHLTVLAVWFVALVPLAAWSMRVAVARAKDDGTLTQF